MTPVMTRLKWPQGQTRWAAAVWNKLASVFRWLADPPIATSYRWRQIDDTTRRQDNGSVIGGAGNVETTDHDLADVDEPALHPLVARSSFGTPEARQAARGVSSERVQAVLRRAQELKATSPHPREAAADALDAPDTTPSSATPDPVQAEACGCDTRSDWPVLADRKNTLPSFRRPAGNDDSTESPYSRAWQELAAHACVALPPGWFARRWKEITATPRVDDLSTDFKYDFHYVVQLVMLARLGPHDAAEGEAKTFARAAECMQGMQFQATMKACPEPRRMAVWLVTLAADAADELSEVHPRSNRGGNVANVRMLVWRDVAAAGVADLGLDNHETAKVLRVRGSEVIPAVDRGRRRLQPVQEMIDSGDGCRELPFIREIQGLAAAGVHVHTCEICQKRLAERTSRADCDGDDSLVTFNRSR